MCIKYVVRYRTIRDTLNASHSIEALSLYDLTNHYMDNHQTAMLRLRKSFIKWDAVFIYCSMSIGSLVLWWMMNNLSFESLPLILGG